MESNNTAHLSSKIFPTLQDVHYKVGLLLEDKITAFSFAFLTVVLLLGLFGPYVAPYEYNARVFAADGSLLRSASPSLAHPLGTTDVGQDVFSRLLYGARPTVITGLLGGSMIMSLGVSIGVTAGYHGGRIDNVLMRFTDIVYSIPVIPFAIVFMAMMGTGFYTAIAIIGLIFWRGSARVIRSQVLQIKERPFVTAARATGASDFWIVRKHILPNIGAMAILYFALGIGYSIITQAGLAFLGVTTPFLPSWGIMVRNAYNSGTVGTTGWWWAIPPGMLITLTVLSTYMLGRGYENISGVNDEQQIAAQEGA